jgi:hypothetical protein
LSTASQSPERTAIRGGNSAITRQIARGSNTIKLVTRPMRGVPARESVLQLLSSIEAIGAITDSG